MERMRGFTLGEAVASLSVAAVLALAAPPSWQEFIRWSRTTTALSTLTSSLAEGRLAAVAFGQDVVVCPSTDGVTCSGGTRWEHGWITFRDTNGDRQRGATEELRLHTGPLPRDVHVFGTAGRRQVRFQRTGWSAGSNATLTVCFRHELAGRVVINNAGRVRVERTERLPCRGA